MSTETVTVDMEVTETVTYAFPVTVEVPVGVADDPDALNAYLAGHDELWLGQMPQFQREQGGTRFPPTCAIT
ncbi:hypothetical protein ABZX85_47665 [Streptomyces sp. NPDC004539]|uniref:hypothetical protein n=1 Tax=Streptomyces sp. NPDC004539 TaxID=3154280 RepID=UPI0033B2D00F